MKMFPEKTKLAFGFALLRIFFLVYVTFGLLLYLRQDAYLFLPPMGAMSACPSIPHKQIITMEGTRAYYLVSGTSTKLAVLYHGNGESACDSTFLAHWLTRVGYNVLLVEYAGYAGDVAHKPSVQLILRDVLHADTWIKQGNYSETVVIGRSIGTGFASAHAALAPGSKLILISPFDSLSRVAQGHYKMYPAGLLLKADLDNIRNASFAKEILIIHGTEDVIIPIERGKSLFEQLPQEHKKFVLIQGYAHNDVLDATESWSEILSFLSKK